MAPSFIITALSRWMEAFISQIVLFISEVIVIIMVLVRVEFVILVRSFLGIVCRGSVFG